MKDGLKCTSQVMVRAEKRNNEKKRQKLKSKKEELSFLSSKDQTFLISQVGGAEQDVLSLMDGVISIQLWLTLEQENTSTFELIVSGKLYRFYQLAIHILA